VAKQNRSHNPSSLRGKEAAIHERARLDRVRHLTTCDDPFFLDTY